MLILSYSHVFNMTMDFILQLYLLQKEGNESTHLSNFLYCILVCVCGYVIASIIYFNSIYCFCFKIYMTSKWFKFYFQFSIYIFQCP